MNAVDIHREIDKLNERKQFLLTVEGALGRKPASLNEEIFQRYVELESTAKVAAWLRSRGIRTQRNASFQAGDVSSIVQNEHQDTDPVLLKLAHEIFARNRTAAFRQYG
jgi:hypothetical protein